MALDRSPEICMPTIFSENEWGGFNGTAKLRTGMRTWGEQKLNIMKKMMNIGKEYYIIAVYSSQTRLVSFYLSFVSDLPLGVFKKIYQLSTLRF